VQTHTADDWFVGFNTGLKAKFWRAASEPWADDEAQDIAALLDLPAGARVLDAPSGAGRIAVRLAGRGLEVTGIDISDEEVEEATCVASERGVTACFEQGDIRALPSGGSTGWCAGATASATSPTKEPSSTWRPPGAPCAGAGSWSSRA
jgi:SAM-dependent methyltransferase